MKNNKIKILFSIFLGIAFFVLLQIKPPQEALSVSLNLDIPSRYAFIFDAKKAQFLVIDLEKKESLSLEKTATIPEISKINTARLIYAKKGQKSAYLRNLIDGKEEKIITNFPILDIYLQPEKIYFLSKEFLEIYDLQTQKITQELAISEIKNLHFFEGQIIILTSEKIVILDSNYQIIKSENLGFSDIQNSVFVPTGEALLFAGFKNNQWQALKYNLEEEKLISYPLDGQFLQAYSTNSGKNYYWLTDKKLLLKSKDYLQEFVINNSQKMALAWLDKRLFLLGENNIFLDKNNKFHQLNIDFNQQKILDLYVTPSSNEILILQENNLQILNAKNGEIENIKIQNLISANKILMGGTYTLCH